MKNQNWNINWKYLLWLVPVGVLPLVQFSWLQDTALLPKFTLLSVFLLAIIGLLFFKSIKNTFSFDSGLFRHPIVLLLASFCLYSFIAVFYSTNTTDALFEACKMTLLFIYFFVLCTTNNDPSQTTRFFMNSMLLMFTVALAIGLYQFFSIQTSLGYSFDSSYLLTATFSHRNLFSHVVLLSLPVLFYHYMHSVGWKKRFFLFLGAVAVFFLLALFVRSVWVAFLGSLFLCGVLFFWFNKSTLKLNVKKKLQQQFTRRTLIVLLLLFSITGFGLRKLKLDQYVWHQVKSFGHLHYGSAGDRIDLWKKTIHLMGKSPIIGNGLASWRVDIAKMGVKGLESEDSVTFYQRPHNDFIWVLHEQGVVGLLIYLAVLVVLLLKLLKLIRNDASKENQLFYFLILFSFISYCFIAFFSFPKERYTHSIIFTALSAVIVRNDLNYFPRKKAIHTSRKWIWVTTVLLLTGICTFFAFREKSEARMVKVLALKDEQKWQPLLNEIENVNTKVFNMDYTGTPVKWYSGVAHLRLNQWEEAEVDLQRAYELNPNHIHVLNNWGSVNYRKKEVVIAKQLYKKALDIHPLFKEANLNMAVLYFNLSATDSSVYYMQQIDTNSIHVDPVYKQYLVAILNQRMQELHAEAPLGADKHALLGIQTNLNWTYDIFLKSTRYGISFEKMVQIDVDYVTQQDD